VILKKNAADRFSTVLRSWEGETVVLIGGGWSLTREQVELVGQARDRGLVKVGAVNDAYLWAPWADVHYAADAKWHAWHSQGIDKPAIGLKADQVRQLWTSFAGEKCTIQNSGGEVADPAVHVMRNRAGPGLHSVGLSLDPAYLVTGHNSGFQLINLVVLAGAKRIILLGYDGAQNAKTGATHFHGSHPTPTYVGSYEYYRRAFTTAERPLQQAGVDDGVTRDREDLLSGRQREGAHDGAPWSRNTAQDDVRQQLDLADEAEIRRLDDTQELDGEGARNTGHESTSAESPGFDPERRYPE